MSETKNLFNPIIEWVTPQKTDYGYTQFGGLWDIRESKFLLKDSVNESLSQHNFSPDRVKYIEGKAADQIQYLFQAFTNSISPEFQLKAFPSSSSGKFNTISNLDFGDSRWRQVFEDVGVEEIFENRGHGFVGQINNQGQTVSRKINLNRFCDHQGFFDLIQGDILLAQNQNSLFSGEYRPLLLVCMNQSQMEPLPNNHDKELLMGQDGYYTILEDMASEGNLVILNGLGSGSVSDLHAQILPSQLIREKQLEVREYELVNIATRQEALNYMNWCWRNGVYTTARILGNNQWVVTVLSDNENQPISVYTQNKKDYTTICYLDELEEDELIQVILAFIYNPGGFETNCNNLFSRQNAISRYKELVVTSNWSDNIKTKVIAKMDNLDFYQHALTPMSQESIQSALGTINKQPAFVSSMIKFVQKVREVATNNFD